MKRKTSLMKAAEKYAEQYVYATDVKRDAFAAGARWQKRQDIAAVRKNCNGKYAGRVCYQCESSIQAIKKGGGV